MTTDRLFSAIEGHEFASRVGVASSRSQFDRALFEQPEITDLIKRMSQNDEFLEAVAQRLRYVAKAGSSPRYVHRYDVAIAAYLRALDLASSRLAEAEAAHVAQVPNIWWAAPLARQLLKMRTHSESEDLTHVVRLRGSFSDDPERRSSSAGVDYYPAFSPPSRLAQSTASSPASNSPGEGQQTVSSLADVQIRRMRVDTPTRKVSTSGSLKEDE